VVKLEPVPTNVPPLAASYQSIAVPAELVADKFTVPDPHLEPFTGAVGAEGSVLTVMTTVEVAAVHGPTPSGSFDVNVRVTVPVVIDGV